MAKSKNINENDVFHFNIGVPLVATLILFIANIEIFVIYYVESYVELFKMYLFCFFFVFAIDYFRQKYITKNTLNLGLNLYKNVLGPFGLVLIILVTNLFVSHTVFETNIKCGKMFDVNMKEYNIPQKFKKFYSFNREETRESYNSNNIFTVKIDESFFGYLFLKQKDFQNKSNFKK